MKFETTHTEWIGARCIAVHVCVCTHMCACIVRLPTQRYLRLVYGEVGRRGREEKEDRGVADTPRIQLH
jgi:hypothetical protein